MQNCPEGVEHRLHQTRVSESDLRVGVDRLAAYVKKLPKETIGEPLKKAAKHAVK